MAFIIPCVVACDLEQEHGEEPGFLVESRIVEFAVDAGTDTVDVSVCSAGARPLPLESVEIDLYVSLFNHPAQPVAAPNPEISLEARFEGRYLDRNAGDVNVYLAGYFDGESLHRLCRDGFHVEFVTNGPYEIEWHVKARAVVADATADRRLGTLDIEVVSSDGLE